MSSTKTSRWLDLIAFLLSHRFPVTREDIFTNVNGYLDEPPPPDRGRGQGERVDESARKKFERDKDELRSLGIDIETLPIPDAAGDEPASGYRLRPGAFYLPYLELEPDLELEPASTSIADRPYQGLARLKISQTDLEILDRATQLVAQRTESPLGKAAASARRKLEFDLPLPQAAVERVLAVQLHDQGTRSLEVLQGAVADRVAVTCQYHSIGSNQDETRSIEPYGLFFNWGRWYCVARARDRDALRVFRVDRMRHAVLEKGQQASFEIPSDFSIRSYVGRAPWELSGTKPTPVRVRFSFPESRRVQAQGVGQAIEPLMNDGGAILEFPVQDPNPFLRWLLTFRNQAELLSPESLAKQLAELRGQVARLYA
jgi:predicted DNA-binding transcriptional regulator YafY